MTDRPFVYINMAMTVDGKITSAAREYPRFTSTTDRRTMDRLRAEADGLLVGGRTLRADNPKLHVRDAEMRDYRRSLGKPEGLTTILVTASANLDPTSRFFEHQEGAERIVATVESAPQERLRLLAQRAQLWTLGAERVELKLLLERLKHHGVERLLAEGGGELNWELVRQNLVDELYVTIAPSLLGGRDAPTLLEGEGLSMAAQRRLELLDLRREGDELYCRYAVRHCGKAQ